MNKLIIDKDRCKGCGLCVNVCPKKILFLDQEEVNILGYHPVASKEGCIACGFCATVCPDIVFTIYKEEKEGE
ncbi:4Fe-4S dicluster domain-containing protein [Thermovenabulum gondwanense]|uniref:4Fe-4S ferredoxin-type domain-containing protein n=1 Tax=Thermovenabulum gondwanense TaxID=520767 RepID=A0A162MV77_9FIRM|nr:4Fe-4S dicluster domain-containing protein [Thermovenabulum gondwanense]KYO67798.1 hypothetical protein ATZ99_04380 [Thermovenabulum gondwanense]